MGHLPKWSDDDTEYFEKLEVFLKAFTNNFNKYKVQVRTFLNHESDPKIAFVLTLKEGFSDLPSFLNLSVNMVNSSRFWGCGWPVLAFSIDYMSNLIDPSASSCTPEGTGTSLYQYRYRPGSTISERLVVFKALRLRKLYEFLQSSVSQYSSSICEPRSQVDPNVIRLLELILQNDATRSVMSEHFRIKL